MSSDLSPWIRQNLQRLFGKGLAAIAFGEQSAQARSVVHDNLIIEQESSTEVRQANLARKQTVPGALEALKHDLAGNTVLKEALWAACNSPCVGLVELSDFADICSILYERVDRMVVVLQYPRYWNVEHLGKVRYHIPKPCVKLFNPDPMLRNRVSFGSSRQLAYALHQYLNPALSHPRVNLSKGNVTRVAGPHLVRGSRSKYQNMLLDHLRHIHNLHLHQVVCRN